MRAVVIDCQIGNISSIINMLKRIGVDAIHSNIPEEIRNADKLILPGVGAFDHGMKSLQDFDLIELLNNEVLIKKKPILGICLGMQLLLDSSEEGHLPGLGWLQGKNKKFQFTDEQSHLKVPHMGWNVVKSRIHNPLLENDENQETRFYFVHSYHAVCNNKDDVIATTHYGYEFPAIIGRDHIIGAQFHPEKSHKFGMQLLKKFIEYPI